MEVFTIGYEKAALGDFLDTLRAAGIAVLIDVRDLPLSRRPGFSKRQLRAAVEQAGIEYVHLKGLGTPKEGRTAARLGDTARFWEIVERQLATPEAEFDLRQAAAIAGSRRACLLCYEADVRTCHRHSICRELKARFGLKPHHLSVTPDRIGGEGVTR